MADRIPITAAERIGKAHEYDQVIILARRVGEPGLEWVTTWGKDRTHCAAAATIGDALRDNVTPTLERLRIEKAAAEAALSEARATQFATPTPRPIEEARRDGTMYRLLVDYEDGGAPLEDATIAWTIGHNNFDNDEQDVWQFAGWSWSHDHYTQGRGRVTHFLPFENPDPESVR